MKRISFKQNIENTDTKLVDGYVVFTEDTMYNQPALAYKFVDTLVETMTDYAENDGGTKFHRFTIDDANYRGPIIMVNLYFTENRPDALVLSDVITKFGQAYYKKVLGKECKVLGISIDEKKGFKSGGENFSDDLGGR